MKLYCMKLLDICLLYARRYCSASWSELPGPRCFKDTYEATENRSMQLVVGIVFSTIDEWRKENYR